MVKPTITPWRSQTDLLSVRDQIYSPSPEDQQRAVQRVMAWKLRGNLPHAVESTALLVDAILHHTTTTTTNNNNSPAISTFSIRAVYSAAFTRFVTGFCDMGRNKARALEPSSMLDIAKQLGMPEEFVALRHEATHEELPAIQRLTKAAEDGLAWLWNVYWSRIDESESDESVSKALPGVKVRAKEIFRTYRGSRREALKAKKLKDKTGDITATSKLLLQLVGANKLKLRAVADVLVEDKLLVPSKRELGAPLEGAYLIWDGLLRTIIDTSNSFLVALQQSMLSALKEADAEHDADCEALCQWVLHMTEYAASPEQQKAYMSETMATSCMHTTYWLKWLGKSLLETSDAAFKEEWQDLVEASQVAQVADRGSEDVVMQDYSSLASVILAIGSASNDSNAELEPWIRQPARTLHLPIGVVR